LKPAYFQTTLEKKPINFISLMKYFTTLFILFIILLKLHALGVDNQVSAKISAILPKNAQIGIIVKSLNDSQLIYEHNANHLFMPSSTIKILTAVAALKRLGPNFTYSTQLLGATNSDTCQQEDIYLKFSGDPSLTTKDLTKLFSSLTESGIHHITGDIIYDDLGYNVPTINDSWMLSDIHNCEMVPITQAIIDENYYHFEIHPAKTLSEPSVLKTNLGIEPQYKVDNQVITSSNEDYTWRSYGFVNNVLRIQGKAGIDLKPQRIELPVDDLDFYIQQNIAQALLENKITLAGKITTGKTPENAITLAEHKSATLNTLISNGLKHSHNVPFGALLLQLAALENPSTTSWKAASNIMAKTLQSDYSIDLSEAIIDDGIGLSRYNLMSPKQLSDVLIAAYKDPSISSYFTNTLAQNCSPGKLQNRLTESNLKGRVYAKTGSMTSISTIAGYLKTNQNNLLSFVIFVNGFSGKSLPYRNFQDDVCRILIEHL